MNSRVERYRYEDEVETPSRTEKNKNLYSNLSMSDFTKYKPESNTRVIEESPKTIDIEKIKKYIESNQDKKNTKEIDNIVVNNEPKIVLPVEEKKEYDLNSVLERAKRGRELYYEDEKHRKLRDTQYDILSKIEMYDKKDTDEDEEKFNTDERTLIDLINTVTINKKSDDLFKELKSENTSEAITGPIEEECKEPIINEIKKEEEKTNESLNKDLNNTLTKNLDRSFYTNSMSFSKDDFEGFEELEKTVKKNNNIVKVGIVLLILVCLATLFVVFKYVLNIF